ncbi:heat shock protein Hsp90 [Gautieria morchelliformis]|nr:heat shock protein Hsp90 [Gautieria morchelliformis]
MRLLSPFVLTGLLSTCVLAQDASGIPKQKHDFQSDVTRLRKIVINSLYSHRDIFLRELLSNANDALEKLRLTSLTDKQAWDPEQPLNITIKAVKDEEGSGGRIIITDYGIGMTPEELTTNLGTLAKSGTSEFLAKAESSDGTGQGNLIGAFGLGFYSSFLVADRVYVASVASKSDKNANPSQHVFSSTADDSSFEVYPDPRGNTLGRGTEITLVLKPDTAEFLEVEKLKQLVEKHSSFSSAFPIYLYTTHTEEVPDLDHVETPNEDFSTAQESTSSPADDASETPADKDEDEAIVEDAGDAEDAEDVKITVDEEEEKPLKMKTVVTTDWLHLNAQPPIWTRDPKTVTDEEYKNFYKATFKDFNDPLAWHHFSGDAGSSTSFKAILYLPSKLPSDFWQGPVISNNDIRLYNKRVFITSDLGESMLPKWMSWIKAIVDAEDLPLNVSREMLQSTRFLRQIKQILTRRLIQLLQRISQDTPEKYQEIWSALGPVIKLGALEAEKDEQKLAGLSRWASNQHNSTSLDEYVKNRKKGQTQIFFLAGLGQTPEMLSKSLFIEKLSARGYEVLLVNEPLDEILYTKLHTWEKLTFQDVAKTGLKFGDEDEDPEDEKAQLLALTEKFQPLITWLKNETSSVVLDVTLSNRLVTSPCAIVAQMFGYSANMERLMNAQNSRQDKGMGHSYAKKQKNLEINPNSPLIEGLLRRVKQLPGEDEEPDLEAEEELREVASILVDGALVRSGFDVPDANIFFERVDMVLRRSLGVSESAKADATVKPAPPVDPEPLTTTSELPKPSVELPEDLKGKVQIDMEELPDDEDEPYHDEL